MASKFMHKKKIVVSVITAIIMLSQLTGCAVATKTDMLEALDNGEYIEMVVAEPSYVEEKQGEEQEFVWQQLDSLETYKDRFRTGFDKLFNVTNVTIGEIDSKNGPMYIDESGYQDGNTSLSDSLRNKVFIESMADADTKEGIVKLASEIYVDVDETETTEAIYAALNAYYNLSNNSQESELSYFNGNSVINREDFYSMVYRSNSGVGDITSDEKFAEVTGENSGQSIFASQVDELAWLNTDNGSLRADYYKGGITKVEAIYLLMNVYFGDDMNNMDISAVKLKDAKDGGDLKTTPKQALAGEFIEKDGKLEVYNDGIIFGIGKNGEESDIVEHVAKAWQLGVLAKSLEDGTNVQSELYRGLAVANNLGVIGSETDWNQEITKADTIDLIVKCNQVLNARDGYLTEGAIGEMKAVLNGVVTDLDGDGDIDELDLELYNIQGAGQRVVDEMKTGDFTDRDEERKLVHYNQDIIDFYDAKIMNGYNLTDEEIIEYVNAFDGVDTASEPAVSEPAQSEPAVSEPAQSEPAVSEPAVSEPAQSEPAPAEDDLGPVPEGYSSWDEYFRITDAAQDNSGGYDDTDYSDGTHPVIY